jgi:hypothetical protein
LFTPYEHSMSVKNARGGIEYYRQVNTDVLSEVQINLAGTGAGQGDALIGSDDGASGALWTTVKGFKDRLLENLGSATVGFTWATLPALINKINWGIYTANDGVNFLRYVPVANWPAYLAGADATDYSTLFQACIDANKGKLIYTPTGSITSIKGVALIGPTYDGTKIQARGKLKLLPAPTQFANNFQAVWTCLAFQETDNCSFSGEFDGNRAAQQVREQTMCLTLAGVTNFKIPFIECNEIRGDGVYLARANITATSANSKYITIGTIIGKNSTENDGRNLLSIISADHGTCAHLMSTNIGGIVGAGAMPGGLDIEPDKDDESVKHWLFGEVLVVHQGTVGIAIQGRPGFDVTRDIQINVASCINTCQPDAGSTGLDAAGNRTVTNNHVLTVYSANDVRINSFYGEFTNARGDAVTVGDADGVHIFGKVKKVREGARIGNDARDVSGPGVLNSEIHLDVVDTCRFGLRTGKLTNTNVKGRVGVPTTGFYPGGLFAVASFSHFQKNVKYSVDVDASVNWTRSYRNDPSFSATFDSACAIQDCDLSGIWGGFTNQVGDMRVLRYRVNGVTEVVAAPSVGALWLAGQKFNNISGVVGQPKGWTISSTFTLIADPVL